MLITTGIADAAQVRNASPRDVPRVASTLAAAFSDDPVFRWAYPDDEQRRELLPGIFAVFTEAIQHHDESYVAAEGAGAALWTPPGRAPVDEEHAGEFYERLGQAAGAGAERFAALGQLVEEYHPGGHYYYLQFLGVEPGNQGRGLGSRLLAHMLERCDREGVHAYLDATSPDNKRLYERHGFRATGSFALPDSPPLWAMWREPVA